MQERGGEGGSDSELQEQMRAGGVADILLPFVQRSGLRIDDGAAVASQDDALASGADGLIGEHKDRFAVDQRPAGPSRDQSAVLDLG